MNTGLVESIYGNQQSRFNVFYERFASQNQALWNEGVLDARCYIGSPSYWNQIYNNYPSITNRLNFNLLRSLVHSIEGVQRLNRKSMLAIPGENGIGDTSDQISKVFFYLNNKEDIDNTLSDAFKSALIHGISFIHVWVDYRRDPVNGDIKLEKWALNEVMFDGSFRNRDMSDCEGVSRASFVTRENAKILYPDVADFIDTIPLGGSEEDQKFTYLPDIDDWQRKHMLSLVEYLYLSTREKTILRDITDGKEIEWVGDEDDLAEYLLDKEEIYVEKITVPTVKLEIRVGGFTIYDGPNTLGVDCYPLIPVYCYWNPELLLMEERFQSVIRDVRDTQFMFNYRKGAEIDILDSQMNSGVIVKEGAVINQLDLTKRGQGNIVVMDADANMEDIQFIKPADIPAGQFQESKSLEELAMRIMGINEAQIGSSLDQQTAGITEKMRLNSGLTLLQPLFDGLDASLKSLGKLLVKVIQNNFTPGKIARIVGEDPTAEFYSKVWGEYDIVIEDGFNTTTQRQQEFAQLFQLKQLGVNIPDARLIASATIQNKKQLIELLEEQQKKQQEFEQQQNQLQLSEIEARTKLVNAQAAADMGLYQERSSRVVDNKMQAKERYAKAISDIESAALDRAKTIKELESIDVDNLRSALEIIQQIKAEQKKELELAYEMAENDVAQPVMNNNQESNLFNQIVGAP